MKIANRLVAPVLGLILLLAAAPVVADVEILGQGSGTDGGLNVSWSNEPNTHFVPNQCFYLTVYAPDNIANPHDQCIARLYASTQIGSGHLRNHVVNYLEASAPGTPNFNVPATFFYPNAAPFTPQEFWELPNYIYHVLSVDISTYIGGQYPSMGWGPIADHTTVYFQFFVTCALGGGVRTNNASPVIAVTFEDQN